MRMLKYDLSHNPNSIIILISCEVWMTAEKNVEVGLLFQAQAKKLKHKQQCMETFWTRVTRACDTVQEI